MRIYIRVFISIRLTRSSSFVLLLIDHGFTHVVNLRRTHTLRTNYCIHVCDVDEFTIEWVRWSWHFRKCFKPVSGRVMKNHAALHYNIIEFYANRRHEAKT